MDDVLKGFIAGLAATIVLSVLMIIKTQAGMLPDFDVIAILAQAVETPGDATYGWLAHFAVGTLLWGGLFSLASDFLPGSYTLKGVIFGVASWLLMMVLFLPVAGLSPFGTDIGIVVPVVTLVFHIIYGLVLGFVYRSLGGTAHTVEKLT